jgi:hypothetical protein
MFQHILGQLIGGTNLTFPSQSPNGTTANSLRSKDDFTGYISAVWLSTLVRKYQSCMVIGRVFLPRLEFEFDFQSDLFKANA